MRALHYGLITHYQNCDWLSEVWLVVASYLCRGTGSVLVQFMCHLWWKKCYWDQPFLKVLIHSLVSFIISVLHTGIFLIRHRCCGRRNFKK
jgi:hypothetical protein